MAGGGSPVCDVAFANYVGIGGTFEVTRLLRARLARLLTQEVEIRALLRRQQLREANEGRLPDLTGNTDERLALVETALTARKCQRALQFLSERPGRVAPGELQRLPQRLAGTEGERQHRDRVRQVEEDRLPALAHLVAKHEVGNEEPGDKE